MLEVRLDDGVTVPLLRILPDEQTVEPCFVEGRTVTVQLPRLGKQVVTPFGGVIIPWDDLRAMWVRILGGGSTIAIGACD